MDSMKTAIEITNRTKKRIDSAFVKRIIRKTLQLAKKKFSNLEISVVFVSEREIRRINRIYRKKDQSTDVLSFRYDLSYNKKQVLDGEVLLSPEVIAKSAKENQVSFKQELAFVLSHGVLHALGFRHGKKMYGIQDIVLRNTNKTNYESS